MVETFEYRGDAYVRPTGRGTVLIDLAGQPHLDDDVLAEGYWRIEVVATRLTGEALERAKAKPL